MRRLRIGFAMLLGALGCAVFAEEGMPVKLSYLGKDLTLTPPARRLGDECFVPVSCLESFGWSGRILNGRVHLSCADRSANLFLRKVEGAECLPLRAAAQLLGGEARWLEKGTKIGVFARLEWVGAANGTLSVKTSFPLVPKVSTLSAPNRLVVDLPGSAYLTAAPPVTKNLNLGVRIGDNGAGTVRIVCTFADKPTVEPMKLVDERQYEFAWSAGALLATGRTGYLEMQPASDAPVAKAPAVGPAALGAPTLTKVNDSSYALNIPADRLLKGRTKISRTATSVTLEIPNAKIEDAGEECEGFLSRFSAISKTVGKTTLAVLQFAVKGAVGVSVAPGANRLMITLNRPLTATGKINEKTIVIDAGHGGSDPGARYGTGEDAVYEKDLNLAIATRVAESLSQDGAAVIMTRSDDSFPSLAQRAEIANQSEADFFVSVHHNSNRMADSRSGTYTYYHAGSAEGELLAQCIQQEISAVSDLPDRGVLADTTRFKIGGMAVLRKTNMPGVLIEVGYINNATDREKLTDEEWQAQVARAIADGIRSYLGDLKEEE